MTFIEWLASVTERINQTMHFQFDGKPEPLVFHAPHVSDFCFVFKNIYWKINLLLPKQYVVKTALTGS